MAAKISGPDLKRFMDKNMDIKLNGDRRCKGVLRGFDQFMNVVLEETVEVESGSGETTEIGMVMIRGNSIVQFECLDRL